MTAAGERRRGDPAGGRSPAAAKQSSDPALGSPVWGGLPLLFAVIGIGISAYLTVVHYAKLPLACPASGSVINCQAVTTSPYSVVGHTGIPITVPGIVWFVVSGAFALAALVEYRSGQPPRPWLPAAHLVWCTLGLASVLYLIYAEAVRLHEFCEWCTGVHLLVILTFLVALVRWQRMAAAPYQPRPER
jgi:uncharacterized membrane protein